MNKKIFVMILCMIFLVSVVSAEVFTFDNRVTYSQDKKTVLIENTLDLFGSNDIATVVLETPLHQSLSQGYQKVAQFKVTGYIDYKDFISQITFEDMKDNRKQFNRDYDLKMFVGYENVTLGNGRVYQREVWEKLTPADLKKNDDLTIGLFTEVKRGDYVDWIPTLAGKKIDEWATWVEQGTNDWYYFNAVADVTDLQFSVDMTTDLCDDCGGIIKAIGMARGDDGGIASLYGVHINVSNGTNIAYSTVTIQPSSNYMDWANFTTDDYSELAGNETLVVDIHQLTGNTKISKSDTGGSTTEPYFTIINQEVPFTASRPMITVGLYENIVSDDTPNLTISSPENYYNASTTSVSFVATVQEDFIVENVSLLIDGEIDQTNTSGSKGQYTFTKSFSSGFYNWSMIVYDNASQFNQSDTRFFNITILSPDLNIYSPADTTLTDVAQQTFIGDATDNFGISNVSLYLNGVLNDTNSSGINGVNYSFTKILGDGAYTWYYEAYDNDSFSSTSDTWNIEIDATDPEIVSENLTGAVTFTSPIDIVWNYQVYDPNLDTCYYNTSQDTSYEIVTCNSTILTQFSSSGNKTVYYCANDTLGHQTCQKEFIIIYGLVSTQSDYEDPTIEGNPVVFNLTVSSAGLPSTVATLILNNTVYNPTTITAGSGNYYFERTVNIPQGWGSTLGNVIDWRWNYTVTGLATNQNTSLTNVTVYKMDIDNCTDLHDPILNLTLKDEEFNEEINGSLGSIIEADVLIYVENFPEINWSYSNKWENSSEASICVPLGLLTTTSPYKLNLTVGYSSENRVNEFFYIDEGDLNSEKVYSSLTGQSINLMDLATADSTSAVFNYFDEDGLGVDGSIVHVFRNYIGEGLFREVERSKSNDNGDTVIHVVEEDVIYYFVISKNGEILYTSSEYTILCLTSPCSISIEASGDGAEFGTDYDLIEGGIYSINESRLTRKVSLVFELDDPATMNFTLYKYNSDGTFEEIDGDQQVASTGVMTLTAPLTAGNVSFFTVLEKDGVFIRSKWVDFEDDAQGYFGSTLSLLLTGLIVLTLGLMAILEGGAVILFVILGLIFTSALGLVTTNLSTGISITIYLIVVGAVIMWKLSRRNR